jgi:hypothetical protein
MNRQGDPAFSRGEPLRPRCSNVGHGPRLSALFVIITLVILGVSSYFIQIIDRDPLPPTFEEYRDHEHRLPQNNESLPLPEGKDGMYILIENHSIRALPFHSVSPL